MILGLYTSLCKPFSTYKPNNNPSKTEVYEESSPLCHLNTSYQILSTLQLLENQKTYDQPYIMLHIQ